MRMRSNNSSNSCQTGSGSVFSPDRRQRQDRPQDRQHDSSSVLLSGLIVVQPSPQADGNSITDRKTDGMIALCYDKSVLLTGGATFLAIVKKKYVLTQGTAQS